MSESTDAKRRVRRLFQTLVIGSGAIATLAACGDSGPKPTAPSTDHPALADGGAPAAKSGGSGFW